MAQRRQRQRAARAARHEGNILWTLRQRQYGIGQTQAFNQGRRLRRRARHNTNPFRQQPAVGQFRATTGPVQITTAEDELHTMLIPSAEPFGGRARFGNRNQMTNWANGIGFSSEL